MTIREAVSHGGSVLKTAGIDSYSLDSSILLAYALEISRSSLIAKGNESLCEEAFGSFQTYLERRAGGECIAYITGKKEFRALEFSVNPSVLVPRPDTEILVEAAVEHLSKLGENGGIRVLDLCTGSGAVAVSLKHEMPGIKAFAADISADALKTAKKNAQELLGAENSVIFFQGDLFDALPNERYSLIICNPPYIPACEIITLSPEVQKEPRIALDGGKSGLEIIERIIYRSPEYLENGGTLLTEADPRQMEEIKSLLTQRGFKDIKLYRDFSGQQRVIGGKYEE